MTEQLEKSNQIKIWVDKFDEEDWADLMNKPPTGFSWHEEAHLAGEEYLEDGKEYLRCN